MSTAVANPQATAPLPPIVGLTKLEGAVEIPLSLLVRSATNRRHVRNAEKDAELAESIRMRGVQQPIVVRKFPGVEELEKYEIVCGHRRYDASLAAGKTTIPAIIRRLTNAEALEVQAIENWQRDDLDPVDRAMVVRDMLDQYRKAYSEKDALKKIGERLNCKERTLWNVLALGKLIPELQEMLRDGTISASHGYDVGPLSPTAQKEVLRFIKQRMSYGQGAPSVRELRRKLNEELFFHLDAAPWKKDDAVLVRAAGACSQCPKNTAVNPLLSAQRGKGSGTCTDPVCYRQKFSAFLVQIENAVAAEGGKTVRIATEWRDNQTAKENPAIRQYEWKEAKEGSCPNVLTGVVVDGKNPGQKKLVCVNQKCKVHFEYYSGSSRGDYGRTRKRSETEKKAMLQKQRSKKLDEAYRAAATAALVKQVTELKVADLQEVAIVLYERLDRRLQNPVMEAMGWKAGKSSWNGPPTPTKEIAALKPAQLAGFIALLSIADNILPFLDYWGQNSPIKAEGFAKRHKVDLQKIHHQAAAPLRAKWKEIDARKAKAKRVQTSAKKKATAA